MTTTTTTRGGRNLDDFRKRYESYDYLCYCGEQHELLPLDDLDDLDSLDSPVEAPCGIDLLEASLSVRDSLRRVRDYLEKALHAAHQGDVTEAEAWLEAASTEESRHGDDPWTRDVAYTVCDMLGVEVASDWEDALQAAIDRA